MVISHGVSMSKFDFASFWFLIFSQKAMLLYDPDVIIKGIIISLVCFYLTKAK